MAKTSFMPQDTYCCTPIWHFTSEKVKQISNGLEEQSPPAFRERKKRQIPFTLPFLWNNSGKSFVIDLQTHIVVKWMHYK